MEMAKRFTDTDKWKKKSFTSLPMKMKLAWNYLCDNCDNAGIWEVNMGLMSYQMGEEVTVDELKTNFADKLNWFQDDKVFIQSFVDFQYGKLNPGNNAHKGVIAKLEKILAPQQPLSSPSRGAQDKDKDINININNSDAELQEKIKNHDLMRINDEVYAAYKFNHGYPREVFDEFAREAWPLYVASDDKRKNWRRFLTHYIKNAKPQIEERIREMAGNKPLSQLVSELFDADEVSDV